MLVLHTGRLHTLDRSCSRPRQAAPDPATARQVADDIQRLTLDQEHLASQVSGGNVLALSRTKKLLGETVVRKNLRDVLDVGQDKNKLGEWWCGYNVHIARNITSLALSLIHI